MNNIISFSLWGHHSRYLTGALENIKCQQQLFPDWKCRFYCHSDVSLGIIGKLYNAGAEVILKEEEPVIKHMDAPGMFWRFEVLKDKTIDRCIIRDVDGRLTQREVNCVKDWERSGKEFHIIRDNAMHGTLIMGGMWGATKEFIDKIDYDDLIKQFHLLHYTNMYATDQEFLARMIYPLVKNSALIHDDWDRYGEHARKIPHFREGQHYIGEPVEIKI